MSIAPSAVGTRTNWLPAGLTDEQYLALLAGESAPTPAPPPDEDDLPPVTHFASPAGGGDGTEGSPFLVSDFWAVAEPGDHLQLVDGVYTGPNSRIAPPAGLSGTADDRIVVSAETDGGVLIDGQDTRTCILLDDASGGNNWFLVQGINACNGVRDVATIQGSFNVLRRIVGWDADPTANSGVFNIAFSEGNLIEDCAAFGAGRKMFADSQASDSTTFRRLWAMGTLNTFNGGNLVSMGYQAHHATGENIIVTYDQDPSTDIGTRGPLSMGRIDRAGVSKLQDNQYLASMCYSLAGQDQGTRESWTDAGNPFGEAGDITYRDIVIYDETSTIRAHVLRHASFPCYLTNVTEIGNQGASSINSTWWTVTNRVQSATVAGAPSPFQATAGAGARMFFRTVDRVLTDVPLWPWPMDARIRAALIIAGRDPDVMFRGTGNSVTDLMESIFGPIPGVSG